MVKHSALRIVGSEQKQCGGTGRADSDLMGVCAKGDRIEKERRQSKEKERERARIRITIRERERERERKQAG